MHVQQTPILLAAPAPSFWTPQWVLHGLNVPKVERPEPRELPWVDPVRYRAWLEKLKGEG